MKGTTSSDGATRGTRSRTINPWRYFAKKPALRVPAALLKHSSLPEMDPAHLAALTLLVFGVLRLRGGTDDCRPSQKGIGELLGISDRSVRLHLSRLRKVGFIRSKHRRPGGVSAPDVYVPLWNQTFEDYYRTEFKKESGRTIGEPFKWSDFRAERWRFLAVPLDVIAQLNVFHDAARRGSMRPNEARSSMASAALCYGALWLKAGERLERTPSRSELAAELLLGYLQDPKDRIGDFLTELEHAKMIRRRRSPGKRSAYSFLQPQKTAPLQQRSMSASGG